MARAAKPKVDNTLSKANGYLTDGSGNPILQNGKRVPVKGTTPTSKPLTSTQTTKAAATANQIAETAYNPAGAVYPSGPNKGKALPALTYQQALAEMRTEGLLADPRVAKIALGALTRVYAPGERGRPLTKQAEAALSSTLGSLGSPLGSSTLLTGR